MKTSRLVALACALLPTLAASMTVTKPVIVVTGDSFSRRSGVCSTTSFDQCEASQELPQQESYSLYLNSATRYGVVVTDNSARGGETCTAGNGVLGGLHAGAAKGLVSDVNGRINQRPADTVSILIGANDVLKHGRPALTPNPTLGPSGEVIPPPPNLEGCIEDVLAQIHSSKKVVVMTYPPVINPAAWGYTDWDFETPWGPASQNNARLLQVNEAIRNAVRDHNAKPGANPVLLADTSSAWTEWEASTYVQESDGIHPNISGARRLATTWFHQVCGRGFIACSR